MSDIPDPFANYTMKERPATIVAKSQSNGLTEREIALLDTMTKEQLIALIKRVSGAMWGICLKTPEETAQAMLDKLAHEALASGAHAKDCITAINSWLDRTQGKPIARQEIRAQMASINADVDFDLLKRIKQDIIEGRFLIE